MAAELNSPHPFDLQARAERAICALTGLLDASREGLMYFLGEWRSRPPRADHCLWDCGDGSGRHVDALTLARIMVPRGSTLASPSEEELQLEAWVFRCLGEEGLSWLPQEEWAQPWGAQYLLAQWQPGEPIAEVSWAQRGSLMALLTRFLHTHQQRYLDRARRLVDGLLRIAVKHPDGLYFPEGYYRQGGWRHHSPGLCFGLEVYNAVVAYPALRLYELCGYEPALHLAEGLLRFALKHSAIYGPDGSFRLPPEKQPEVAHFHTRTSFALAVLKLGIVTGSPEYIAWAKRTYEEGKTWGTAFGWFPEGLGCRHGEVCSTVDMIELAILLGRHVDRAFYADAERFGRNHLLESQFLSLSALEAALLSMPSCAGQPPFSGRYSTWENVAARQLGAFASRPALNDAFCLDNTAFMQCCNAAGTRALYDLWHNSTVEYTSDRTHLHRVEIHLRFSVETPVVRVLSYEPAAGRLHILAKAPVELHVRLPEGESQAIALAVDNERPAHLAAADGYVTLMLREADEVDLCYPLRERTSYHRVGLGNQISECQAYWRGETVLKVEPPGTYLPLYRRQLDLPPVEPSLPAGKPIPSL